MKTLTTDTFSLFHRSLKKNISNLFCIWKQSFHKLFYLDLWSVNFLFTIKRKIIKGEINDVNELTETSDTTP